MENEIFVIGTGPSLTNVDLYKLRDKTTLAVNDITHELDKLTPTYWMFMDSRFYRKYMKEIKETIEMGTKVITTADIKGAIKLSVYGDRQVLDRGKIEFYMKPINFTFSVGAIGYIALQWAWQNGFRKMYVMGFDSRHPNRHKNYREDYMDREPLHKNNEGYHPKDIWGRAYDYANKFIWDNGGEIWDISHCECGSFQYKDLEEILCQSR